jgi:plastocyanin
VLAGLVLAGCGSSASTKSAAPTPAAAAVTAAKVTISDFKFAPPAVTLKRGGTITFTNRDTAPHTATADDGPSFDTGTLKQGQTKTVTFPTSGTFAYHCAFHAFMKATVVVS